MHEGNLQRLIFLFKGAFDSLGVVVPLVKIEDLSVLIYKGMTVQTRNYHNLDHVFSLTDEQSPIITLSALFHDLVYCQVDRGFLPEIRQIIDPYILESDGQITIKDEFEQDELHFLMLLGIFSFMPGQTIAPTKGLNEFLSALVMVKELEELLSEEILFLLMVCVEASIPFRESAASGEDYFYCLEEKALKINERLDLGLAQDYLKDGILLAVRFANQDVESFAEPNVSNYLETTWKLIPELNVHLRSIDTYSIREYRQALQAMQTSMDKLNPNTVFHQYGGVPADEIYRQMLDRAHKNIKTGQEYLHIKLLTQAILEALAEVTGGDAPLSLFMGDMLAESSHHRRIEDFLPETPLPKWVNPISDLYHLLSCSLDGDATFDLCTAPLSLFVHKRLSPVLSAEGLMNAYEMFDGRLSPVEFLACLDLDVVSPIAKASAEMVITRRDQLQKYVVNS